MKFSLSSIALSTVLACACVSGSAVADPKVPGTEQGFSTVEIMQKGEPAQLHWVSVKEIEKSLEGKPPMAVGFDVDDTVLFSSPGFYRGQQVFSPNGYSYLKSQKFWDKMNCEWENSACLSKLARTDRYAPKAWRPDLFHHRPKPFPVRNYYPVPERYLWHQRYAQSDLRWF